MGIEDIIKKNMLYKAVEVGVSAMAGLGGGYFAYAYSVAKDYASLARYAVTAAGAYISYHVGKALANVPLSMLKGINYLKNIKSVFSSKPAAVHG